MEFRLRPPIRYESTLLVVAQSLFYSNTYLHFCNAVTWTACGNEIAFARTELSNEVRPNLVSSIRSDDVADDFVIPSARLPGALQIEPHVRKNAGNSGLKASEYAIWMLVVAVREHASALIKRIIANDKDLADGYAPPVPNYCQTIIAFSPVSSDNMENLAKNVVEENTSGRRFINSTCLSHVLDTNPSAASRLTSMYSVALDDWRGISSHSRLDTTNCLINLSIQKAARRRQAMAPKSEIILSARSISKATSKSPAQNTKASSKAQSEKRSAKSQLPSSQIQASSPLMTTLVYPAQNRDVISSAQSDESLAKSQLHSHQMLPAGSLLNPALGYSATGSSAQARETFTQTRLHSNQNLPVASFPLDMPQLLPQRTNDSIAPMLHMPPMFTMQMLNQMAVQNMQPRQSSFIQNSAPLANPIFPEIANNQKKPEIAPIVFTRADQRHNMASPLTTSHTSSALSRGSKNFAALLAMSSSQPDASTNNNSISSCEREAQPHNSATFTSHTSSGIKRGSKDLAALLAMPSSQPDAAKIKDSADKATLANASLDQSSLTQSSHTGTEEDVAEQKQDGAQDVTPPLKAPIRSRGFGAKNLAALRARNSISDPAKSSLPNPEK